MLRVDGVGALAALGLEGLDRVPGLFPGPRHEPADRMALPAHFVYDLDQRGAVLALEHRYHLGGLAAAAYTVTFLDGSSPLITNLPMSGGKAFSVPSLSVGSHASRLQLRG